MPPEQGDDHILPLRFLCRTVEQQSVLPTATSWFQLSSWWLFRANYYSVDTSCLTYRVEEPSFLATLFRDEPPLYFTAFKTDYGTLSRLELCRAWACASLSIKFTRPLLNLMLVDDNNHRPDAREIYADIRDTYNNMWGCYAVLDMALRQLTLWEEHHIVPSTWGPADLAELERIGKALQLFKRDKPIPVPQPPISALFVVAASEALQMHERGYDPVWFDLSKTLQATDRMAFSSFLLGFSIKDKDIMPHPYNEGEGSEQLWHQKRQNTKTPRERNPKAFSSTPEDED